MEGSRRRALAAFLLLFLGPVLALVAAEIWLRQSTWRLELMHRFPEGKPAKVEALLHDALERHQAGSDFRAVILGSSVAAQDLDEERLARQLGWSGEVLNLGANGSPMWNTAMLLPRALELEPELVVLVAGPRLLAGRQADEIAEFYDPAVAWQIFGPRQLLAQAGTHASRLLEWALYSQRHRGDLRGLLLYGDEQRRGPGHPRSWPQVGERELQAGLRTQQDRNLEARRDPSTLNRDALRWLSRRLAAEGVALVVVPSPMHPRLGASFPRWRLEPLDAEAERDGFLLIQPGPLLRAHDYPAASFRDAAHLLAPGQARFTDTVAAGLRAHGLD